MQIQRKRSSGLCVLFVLTLTVATAAEKGAESFKRSRAESREHFPKYPGMSLDKRLEKDDLNGEIAADRQLTAADRDYLIALSDYLIDKRNQDYRSNAAYSLGMFGHRMGIPALLAVLRDQKESQEVLSAAVKALSKIKDKRVVGYLIEDGVGCEDVDVAWQANDHLAQLVGGGLAQVPGVSNVVPDLQDPDLVRPDDRDYGKERRKEYEKRYSEYMHNLNQHRQTVWRAWWKKNRARIHVEDLHRSGRMAY